MSILILGKGYIGTYLAEQLNCDIKNRYELNYHDPEQLLEYLAKTKPKWVINCSGFTGLRNVDDCERFKIKTWQFNVVVPLAISRCLNRGIPFQFVNISSGCIYNDYWKDFVEGDFPNFGLWNPESSFYCKSKHACEINLEDVNCYQLRIRMPFCSRYHRKNYLDKIYRYDKVIPEWNSLTSVDDFAGFIKNFTTQMPEYGIYNVVNRGSINAFKVKEILGIKEFQPVSERYLNLDCKRSNCILSTEKIAKLGLSLPPVQESLERDAELFLSGIESAKETVVDYREGSNV